MKKEKIYVVYTHVNVKTPWRHKDIYYEKSDGTVILMRARPEGDILSYEKFSSANSSELENLRRFQAQELDREVIVEGDDLSQIAANIDKELSHIKSQRMPYKATDTNSNWAADKALYRATFHLPNHDQSDENWSPGSIRIEDTHRYHRDYRGGDSDFGISNHLPDDAETDIDKPSKLAPFKLNENNGEKRPHEKSSAQTPNKKVKLTNITPIKENSSTDIPEKGPERVDKDPFYNPLDYKSNGFEDLMGEVHLLKKNRKKFIELAQTANRSNDFPMILDDA